MIGFEVTVIQLGAVLTALAALFGAVAGGMAQYRSIRADRIREESERAAHTADAAAIGLKYVQFSLDTLQDQHEEDQEEIRNLRKEVNQERQRGVERDARVAALEREVRACHEERDQLRRRIAQME